MDWHESARKIIIYIKIKMISLVSKQNKAPRQDKKEIEMVWSLKLYALLRRKKIK